MDLTPAVEVTGREGAVVTSTPCRAGRSAAIDDDWPGRCARGCRRM